MTGTVLIVEDEARLADILEDYLRREGFRVEKARDGARALELWRAANPDFILLDLMLPVIDGFEVARRIRETLERPHHHADRQRRRAGQAFGSGLRRGRLRGQTL